MMALTNCRRAVASLAIAALMLALGLVANAQAWPGGGHSRGGMGGCSGQNSYGTASQNNSLQQGYPNQQQTTGTTNSALTGSTTPAVTSGTTGSMNNPATVLANASTLSLTAKQVQRLTQMQNAGGQHAARVLSPAQKMKLATILGIAAPGAH